MGSWVQKTLLKVTFTYQWFMSLPQLTGKLVVGIYFSCPPRNYLYKFSPCSVTGHYWHHLKARCIALWCSRCSLNNIQCCVHFPNHCHLSHTLHCSDTHLNNSLYLKQSKIIFTWQVHCMHCVATTISGIFRILNYASNDYTQWVIYTRFNPNQGFTQPVDLGL